MRTKRAFTLIELLVVIAIIALLISITIPALRIAKEIASGVVCQSNQKGLATAWHLYQGNNNGLLVGGSTYHSGTNGTPYRWVERPLFNDTDNPEFNPYPPDAAFTLRYRLNGIRAGRLFPYTSNEKLYHCPGDRTFTREQEPYAAYRSYAVSGLMNSEDFLTRQPPGTIYRPIATYRTVTMPTGGARPLRVAVRLSEILAPGTKLVFVEEDTSQGGLPQTFNLGGFVLMFGGVYWAWWDTPAYFHNGQSTIGFADGHAEKKKWEDLRTIKTMKGEIPTNVPQTNNPDLAWMNRAYMPMQ